MQDSNETKQTVLIVEDDPLQRKILTEKLTHSGLKIISAQNGQVGLDLALQHHPDLILLDIILPIMDGITMLKQLRQDGWGKTVPVIILTNLSESTLNDRNLVNLTTDYLVKTDWELDDIANKIKNVLGTSPQ